MLPSNLGITGPTRGRIPHAVLAFMLLTVQQAALADTAEDIAALKRRMASMQRTLSTLQTQNAELDRQVAGLKVRVSSLQVQNSALKPFATLAPYIRLDLSTINGLIGPHVIFEGVNLHVRSGMGPMADVFDAYTFNGGTGAFGTAPYTNGLGNLIVGYDELPCMAKGCAPAAAYRVGSHNLVVGPGHQFSDLGALLAGANGVSNAPSANVLGGWGNQALGVTTAVLGGELNQVGGRSSTVIGGLNAPASTSFAAIAGASAQLTPANGQR